jgi:hypothetical protein
VLETEELYPEGCFGPLDEWLRRRAVQLVEAVVDKPSATFNALFDKRRERVAAYRVCAHPEVSMQRLLEPAAEAVARRVAEQGPEEVKLCVHDRTEVNLTHLEGSMKGLGEIGNPACRGFFLQTGLGLDCEGVALGVVTAQTWTRSEAEHGKAQDRRQRAFEDKESFRWWQGIEQAEVRVGRPGALVHVIDAEGDVYELMERALARGARLLVRAAQNRRVEGEAGYLWQAVEKFEVCGSRTIRLPSRPALDGKPARSVRQATVSLRYGQVQLKAPHGREGCLSVSAVLVREESAPTGHEAVEWLLLTSDVLQSPEQAWMRVDWYTRRWTIEDFHKCLKTGCSLEKRQFEDVRHLQNALAFFMLASVRLLAMRNLSRTQPDTLATEHLEQEEVEVLRLMAPQLDSPPLGPTPTLGQLVPLIARLGGHMGRKSDGPPGWITLWRGWQRLSERVEGYRLALSLPPTSARQPFS